MTAKRGREGSCTPVVLTKTDCAEFHSLPECIQRKFFSTYERLQIAQNSAQIYCAPPLSAHTDRISTPPGKTFAFVPNGSLRSRLRSSTDSGSNLLISKAEAHWYRSLPDKVRRQHFSREEQVLLNARADALSPRTSRSTSIEPDRLHRISVQSLQRYSSSLPERVDSPQRPSKIIIEEPEEISDPTPKDFSLDSAEMNCFGPPPGKIPRKSSVRRNLSLSRPNSTQLFRLSSSSAQIIPQSPKHSTFTHHKRHTSRATTRSGMRPSTESSTHGVESSATHYQDPDARKKLRQYLASPHKFDEAVEFGFPNPSPPVVDPEPFKAPRSTSGNDVQTFLKRDTVTFIDRYDEEDFDDASSDEGLESPATPADADVLFHDSRPYGSSIFAGLDASDIPSLNFNIDPDIFSLSTFPRDPLANREMTLRMTLTRADLRAQEDDLYGWTKKEDDPLALEPLHVTDDLNGTHGAFAIKQSRRSGMFKKIFDKVKNDRRH